MTAETLDTSVLAPTVAAARLPRRTSLGFGVGTVGVSILLNTVAVYFPTMMVTVLGFSPVVAGALLTGSKVYDLGADIAIGVASDRTRSPWGRRRPYLLAGALISSLAFALLFRIGGTGAALVTAAAAILVLYSTGYSLFNVPYLAMPYEMAPDYHRRTDLLSYRTFFLSIGQMVAIPGAAALVSAFGGDRGGYAKMAMVLGAVVLATMLGSFFGTAGAAKAEAASDAAAGPARRLAFGAHVRLAMQSRPFVILTICKFCNLLALASTTSTQLLFLLNVSKVGYAGQFQLSLASNLVLAASMPLWVRAGRRIEKSRAYLIATVIYMLATSSWLLSGPNEPMAWLWVRGAVLGVGTGGMLLMGLSMLQDVMQHDRQRTGLQRAGVFSSVYAIMEKSAFALGPGLMGAYLTLAHYVPTHHGKLVPQPASAVQALYVGVAVVPAVLGAVVVVLLRFYDLDEAKLKAGG